jgi:hypothetical protein
MKGTIIGTDLLESGDSVKILEVNTNTTIYNVGAESLDYTAFFNVLTQNSITELHFIWTEGDAYSPLPDVFRFEEKLIEKCTELNILYTPHKVPKNSVTVPYIEDAEHKFILRQSFDTTALVDEMYCADKFQFFDLMRDTTFIPKTNFSSIEVSMDTLDEVNYSNGDEPNTLKKYRYPTYDLTQLPALYSIQNSTDLSTIKNEENSETNILTQEFIYDENNIVDGRYSIIRSIDIIYGSELDVINMGGYKQSTIIPLDIYENEFLENSRKLNQKSRYKYITKELGNFSSSNYHTDEECSILMYDGTLKDVNTIQLGDYIKSVDFVDLNGNHAANFEQGVLDVFGWDSTLQQTVDTFEDMQSQLNNMSSVSADTIYIRITLENGLTWTDAPSCSYYIEEKDSLSTKFEKVNRMYVGDKLIMINKDTNELSAVEITGLAMEHTVRTIYSLDFEPSDLFLVDSGDGFFSIMHNSCYCTWSYCGDWCYQSYCPGCGGGFEKIQQ